MSKATRNFGTTVSSAISAQHTLVFSVRYYGERESNGRARHRQTERRSRARAHNTQCERNWGEKKKKGEHKYFGTCPACVSAGGLPGIRTGTVRINDRQPARSLPHLSDKFTTIVFVCCRCTSYIRVAFCARIQRVRINGEW